MSTDILCHLGLSLNPFIVELSLINTVLNFPLFVACIEVQQSTIRALTCDVINSLSFFYIYIDRFHINFALRFSLFVACFVFLESTIQVLIFGVI